MTRQADSLVAGPAGGLLSWLVWGAVGPAAVALPVNWTAEKLATAAMHWFKRLRQADDLSRLVKAGAGTSTQLSRAEINSVRRLLEDDETWRHLGGRDVAALSNRIAACLREGRSPENSREAASIIARGLLEFVIFELEPGNFQKVVLVRLQQMTDQVSAVDKALYDLHSDLYARVDDAADLIKRVMDRLPPGIAGRGEITVYLKTLIDWLSSDPWPRDRQFGGPVLSPAAIECQLRVSAVGRADRLYVDADELTAQCLRLVILGGPGSGKTWLAKRTARRCAENALEALLDGAAPDYVELPLFTTCSRLFTADSDIRSAAVTSALNQLGDLGGSRINEALRVLFTERNAPTLLVIDSLDEARGSDERLRQADTLPWRIVLTSRPSAWNQQLKIEDANDSHRVGQLQPLRYPEDIEPFIQRWFARDPGRGKDLAAQIARRSSLQHAATVPLLLAFCCIVGGDQPLPEFRRHLYAKVLKRILTGRWRNSGYRRPDEDTCLETLRAWAWSATACDTASGIGTWADDILTEDGRLHEIDQEAVDHVATPLGPPDIDTGKTLRRFIHRSIREHLVAEHIASLPADRAVTALLPHLWYDPDWEYAVPVAVAMHPQRDQLLRDLICRAANADRIPEDLSVIDAAWEFHRLLARVAAESSEADWSPEVVEMIGQSRVDLARSAHIDDLTWASSWDVSDRQVREILLNMLACDTNGLQTGRLLSGVVRLAGTGEGKRQVLNGLLGLLASQRSIWRSTALVSAVAQLDPTAEDKRQAREALFRLLANEVDAWEARSSADSGAQPDLAAEDERYPRDTATEERDRILDEIDEVFAGKDAADDAESLVHGLVRLDLTTEEKHQACHALLRLLPSQWDPEPVGKLLATVVQLVPTVEDKRQAREGLLGLLADENSGYIAVALANGVVQLRPTAQDKQRARERLLTLLGTNGSTAANLASGLAQLDPTDQDKQRARETLLMLLASQSASEASKLVTGLVELGPTDQDKQQARETLLMLLTSQTASQETAELVLGVLRLDPTADDIMRAGNALLTFLASQTDISTAVSLAIGLVHLYPIVEDKRQVFDALVGLLVGQDDLWTASILVNQLIKLDLTAQDKRQACQVLLSLLANKAGSRESISADWIMNPDWTALIDGVVRLSVTADDKRQARETLLTLLARQAYHWVISELLYGLLQLEPTLQDTCEVRSMLLTSFAVAPDDAAWLVMDLIEFGSTAQDKQQARETLQTLLASTTEGSTAASLASGLAQLDPTDQDKQRARETMLMLLTSQAAGQEATKLMGGLVRLDPTVRDLNAWHDWTAPPTTELLAAIRRNSDLADWLSALPTLARLSVANP